MTHSATHAAPRVGSGSRMRSFVVVVPSPRAYNKQELHLFSHRYIFRVSALRFPSLDVVPAICLLQTSVARIRILL